MGVNVSSYIILPRRFGKVLKKTRFLIILVLFLYAFSSTTDVLGSHVQGEENIIDGAIFDGEYEFNITVGNGDYSLYWEVKGNEIYLAVLAKTTGWVAIGIDPEDRMKNADMIFGWVNSSGVFTVDAFAIGVYGPHPPDTILGGSNNILEFNGTEKGELTIIEIRRLLDTNDEYDKPFPINATVTMIWAISSSDSFENQHENVKRGSYELSLITVPSQVQEISDFMSPLILGAALSVSLVGILVFVDSLGRRQQKEREKDKIKTPKGENE